MTGTYAAAVQRILIGRVVATVGAVVAAVGTFLPWLRSGTRRRSSYEVFSLVDRLGFSQSSAIGVGLRVWPNVPLLLAFAATLQWFPRKWVTNSSAIIVVVYAGAIAAAVEFAPATSLIAVEYGPWVTLAGLVVLAAGALLNRVSPRLSTRNISANSRGIRGPGGG
jgi:hypothetical protein